MGSAFYSEAQIWPWTRDPDLVMFTVNWSDRPDYVLHVPHTECQSECPHQFAECGRFKERIMPIFRATVWVLSSAAAAVEGDAGTQRYVTQEEAESVEMFKAQVSDRYIHDVDTEVSFGPVSEVRR